jgi:hypothetical protein
MTLKLKVLWNRPSITGDKGPTGHASNARPQEFHGAAGPKIRKAAGMDETEVGDDNSANNRE